MGKRGKYLKKKAFNAAKRESKGAKSLEDLAALGDDIFNFEHKF